MSQINEVRAAMMEQLRNLQDPNKNLEKEVMRTEAMVAVVGKLVDSMKVEVEFMKVTGSLATDFIPATGRIEGGDNSKQLGDGKR